MLRFIIRRVVVIIPMLVIVISLTWVLVRLAPGNFYTGEKKLAAGIEANLREKYGLNKPWYVQYGKVLMNAARLDFGSSLKYEGQSVSQILWRGLPVSAAVGVSAYLIALIVGISTGALSALKQNSWIDYSSMTLAMLGISIPNFVLGPLLVLVFSLTLFWFPPALWDGFPSRSLVLPALTLSAIYISYIARLTRSGMLEIMRSDYIRTARAKGLSEGQVVMRHALRGSLLPVVSFSGPELAFLITGTVVVEKVFALPGLGNYFINACFNRDEPLIIGIVAFMSITVLAFNLLVDIAYGFIDPRIRYS
ncbi:MAG TPA: ABC transporter permease [Pyrinomonadaceae bacterium]|nr:ABC transporter permease [Pyrinomonadaceae bacterium]